MWLKFFETICVCMYIYTNRIYLIVQLTHWGRVTHICVDKLNIIGSDNGLSPRRRQAIIWTNVGILLIRPLGTNFGEILFRNQTFSFKKMHLKMSSAKWQPFCLGLNELMWHSRHQHLRSVRFFMVWNLLADSQLITAHFKKWAETT